MLPLITDFGARLRGVVNFNTRPLYLRGNSCHSLNGKIGGL